MHPTSLSVHGVSIGLDAGRLRDHAARLVAVACGGEFDSAPGPSPSRKSGHPKSAIRFASIFVSCSLVA
jgi:hypothetical protein